MISRVLQNIFAKILTNAKGGRLKCPSSMNNTYLIEVDRIEPNGDVVTITERRKLKATKTNKGLERQLNNLVNRISEELKYYQVSYKRYTVSHVCSN